MRATIAAVAMEKSARVEKIFEVVSGKIARRLVLAGINSSSVDDSAFAIVDGLGAESETRCHRLRSRRAAQSS
jgi:hypothetical protein